MTLKVRGESRCSIKTCGMNEGINEWKKWYERWNYSTEIGCKWG